MRPEVRAKLDAAEREHHRRGAVVGVLVVSVLVSAAWALPWWTEQRPMLGVVRFAAPYVNTETGQRGMHLQVELESGQLVNAGSVSLITLRPPAVGTTIKLTERRSFTGYHSYVWSPPQQ